MQYLPLLPLRRTLPVELPSLLRALEIRICPSICIFMSGLGCYWHLRALLEILTVDWLCCITWWPLLRGTAWPVEQPAVNIHSVLSSGRSGLTMSQGLSEEEIQHLEHSSVTPNTMRATQYGKKFEHSLLRRNESCDLATVSSSELNALLQRFYAEVKPAKQSVSVTPSTLCGLRSTIHR